MATSVHGLRGTSLAPTSTTPKRHPPSTTTTKQLSALHPHYVIVISLLSLTLLIGVLYSTPALNAEINARVPSAAIPHLSPSHQPSYWADKRNGVNKYFVKILWLWTTAALVTNWLGLAWHHHNAPESKETGEAERVVKQVVPRGLGRYTLATLGWVGVTQWCLGASLSERVLTLTGAQCVAAFGGATDSAVVGTGKQADLLGKDIKHAVERALCERRWGKRLPGTDVFASAAQKPYWNGGFDISGHTFLLTLSILTLFTSLRPSLASWLPASRPTKSTPAALPLRAAIGLNLAVIIVSWWMLYNTSVWFHGPGEKAMGMLFGIATWWASIRIAGE